MPKKTTKDQKAEPITKKEKANEDLVVIEIAGKQTLLKTGDIFTTDNQGQEPGKTWETDKILLTVKDSQISVGQPYVTGAKVVLEVMETLKGKKLEIIKYKAKSRYRKHTGYRSHLTKVKVVDIRL